MSVINIWHQRDHNDIYETTTRPQRDNNDIYETTTRPQRDNNDIGVTLSEPQQYTNTTICLKTPDIDDGRYIFGRYWSKFGQYSSIFLYPSLPQADPNETTTILGSCCVTPTRSQRYWGHIMWHQRDHNDIWVTNTPTPTQRYATICLKKGDIDGVRYWGEKSRPPMDSTVPLAMQNKEFVSICGDAQHQLLLVSG